MINFSNYSICHSSWYRALFSLSLSHTLTLSHSLSHHAQGHSFPAGDVKRQTRKRTVLSQVLQRLLLLENASDVRTTVRSHRDYFRLRNDWHGGPPRSFYARSPKEISHLLHHSVRSAQLVGSAVEKDKSTQTGGDGGDSSANSWFGGKERTVPASVRLAKERASVAALGEVRLNAHDLALIGASFVSGKEKTASAVANKQTGGQHSESEAQTGAMWVIPSAKVRVCVSSVPFFLFLCVRYVHAVPCWAHCDLSLSLPPPLPFLSRSLSVGHLRDAVRGSRRVVRAVAFCAHERCDMGCRNVAIPGAHTRCSNQRV
jgi:hypothetical protein